MNAMERAQQLIDRLSSTRPNLTQLRAIAIECGKDQLVADALWTHGGTSARLLALRMLELRAIDAGTIERMIADIEVADEQEQRQLCDWLIANVLMKKSALKREAATWRLAPSPLKQRIFWSVQARTITAANQELNQQLLEALEASMAGADAMVQEMMNWCAAQIGIADAHLRGRCIALGERLGLYKEYPVSKGCTSPYLPLWIETVVEKQTLVEAAQP